MTEEAYEKLRKIYANIPIGTAVTAAELASSSSLRPEEAAAAVDKLKASGAMIVGDADEGYRRALPPPLDQLAISARVEGRMGSAVHVFETVATTMATAREMAGDGECHGAAVLAEAQAVGRGRYGRGWSSPGRLGLYVSVILEKRFLPSVFSLLPLAAGVAVAEAVSSVAALSVELKWPNDVFFKGAKLGGILAESYGDPDVIVLGIGLNVLQCPYDLPARPLYPATSLAMAGAGDVDRNELAAAALNSLDRWLERWLELGPGPVLDAWSECNITLGRRIRIAGTGVAGTAVDLTEEGALVVEDDAGGRRIVYSADA